ncbi:MAG: hypothetical protein ACYTEZ_13520 [Planctomycetota bacterium]
MRLEEVLDHVEALRREGNLAPDRRPVESGGDRLVIEISMILADPRLRPEHRERIYHDLVANRAFLLAKQDPRIIDLIYWGEHVATLHAGLRRGRIQTFYYARAMEATCRRCGFEFLPVVGKMDQLGKLWGGQDYERTYRLLSAHLVELDSSGEAAQELGPQG